VVWLWLPSHFGGFLLIVLLNILSHSQLDLHSRTWLLLPFGLPCQTHRATLLSLQKTGTTQNQLSVPPPPTPPSLPAFRFLLMVKPTTLPGLMYHRRHMVVAAQALESARSVSCSNCTPRRAPMSTLHKKKRLD
jgi:hypothetical protein